MRRILPFARTAYDWHGGQGSALYSFASTGGVVWSEGHRLDLTHEIRVCLATKGLLSKERARLASLLRYVARAQVGHSLLHRDTHPDYHALNHVSKEG